MKTRTGTRIHELASSPNHSVRRSPRLAARCLHQRREPLFWEEQQEPADGTAKGLDCERDTMATMPLPSPKPQGELASMQQSPTRLWHKYSKERVYVTPARSTSSTREQGLSSLGWPCPFFTLLFVRLFNLSSSVAVHLCSFFISFLFKLGSLMYLASASFNAIITHRLFNLISSVAHIGSVLVLLVALVTFRGYLLEDKTNVNEVDVISRSEMDNFRHKLQEDKDMFSTHLGLLKKGNLEEVQSELARLETMMKENARKVDEIHQHEVEKLRRHFRADIDQLSARLDSLKHENSGDVKEVLRKVEQMIAGLKTELQKNMADDDLDLRQWVIHSTVSSNNLKDLERRVDTIINYTVDGVDISKQSIHHMIDLSLQAYSADRIGMFDFALENAGGSIMLDWCSPTYSHSVAHISFLGLTLWHVPSSPKVIIQPSLYPGDCWAMQGQSGFATIKMSEEAIVTAVTVDHIPQELTPNGNLNSAPKAFSVFGLVDLDGKEMSFGTFTYDLEGPNIQKFYIDESRQERPSRYVRFEFLSNYGNQDYTCVYRIRVHGHYPYS